TIATARSASSGEKTGRLGRSARATSDASRAVSPVRTKGRKVSRTRGGAEIDPSGCQVSSPASGPGATVSTCAGVQPGDGRPKASPLPRAEAVTAGTGLLNSD